MPGDDDWEHSKWVWKQSLILAVSYRWVRDEQTKPLLGCEGMASDINICFFDVYFTEHS